MTEPTQLTGPIEAKVTSASTAAAIAGGVVWVLATYVFHGVVPDPVVAFIAVAVPGLVAFAAGYKTRHTARTDSDALAATRRRENLPPAGDAAA